MKSDLALSAVLLLGGALLWVDRLLLEPVEGVFDRTGFEAAARSIWPDQALESAPFAQSPLIAPIHSHLLVRPAPSSGTPLFSIYAGHYPKLGRFELGPHDPVICYQSLGYRIVEPPVTIRLQAERAPDTDTSTSPALVGVALQRMVVEQSVYHDRPARLVVWFWLHYGGAMPRPHTGPLTTIEQARARFVERRTDLLWVRVECTEALPASDPRLQGQLLRLMREASRAMHLARG